MRFARAGLGVAPKYPRFARADVDKAADLECQSPQHGPGELNLDQSAVGGGNLDLRKRSSGRDVAHRRRQRRSRGAGEHLDVVWPDVGDGRTVTCVGIFRHADRTTSEHRLAVADCAFEPVDVAQELIGERGCRMFVNIVRAARSAQFAPGS